MSDTTTAPHYQLEEHDVEGWKSLGGYHAFASREAAHSDLHMQALSNKARLRIRETTSNRITWMKNVTAYDEQLADFRDQAVSLAAEFRMGLDEAKAGPDGKAQQALTQQIDACDAVITAIDKIF